jgi:hypothetical protein
MTLYNVAMEFVKKLEGPEYRENFDVIRLWLGKNLDLISQSEYNREASEMGFDVHGRDENGNTKMPDLTQYMPEIIDEFSRYLGDKLP